MKKLFDPCQPARAGIPRARRVWRWWRLPASDLLGAIKERGYILVSTDPNYEPQSFLQHSRLTPRRHQVPIRPADHC
jgi:hypothetical protein